MPHCCKGCGADWPGGGTPGLSFLSATKVILALNFSVIRKSPLRHIAVQSHANDYIQCLPCPQPLPIVSCVIASKSKSYQQVATMRLCITLLRLPEFALCGCHVSTTVVVSRGHLDLVLVVHGCPESALDRRERHAPRAGFTAQPSQVPMRPRGARH